MIPRFSISDVTRGGAGVAQFWGQHFECTNNIILIINTINILIHRVTGEIYANYKLVPNLCGVKLCKNQKKNQEVHLLS